MWEVRKACTYRKEKHKKDLCVCVCKGDSWQGSQGFKWKVCQALCYLCVFSYLISFPSCLSDRNKLTGIMVQVCPFLPPHVNKLKTQNVFLEPPGFVCLTLWPGTGANYCLMVVCQQVEFLFFFLLITLLLLWYSLLPENQLASALLADKPIVTTNGYLPLFYAIVIQSWAVNHQTGPCIHNFVPDSSAVIEEYNSPLQHQCILKVAHKWCNVCNDCVIGRFGQK